MSTDAAAWLPCSSCKGEIGFEDTYYVCSVSTCTRGATDLRFCSVECWDAHVPVMRHRDAWAVESHAPTREEWLRNRPSPPPAAESASAQSPSAENRGDAPVEVVLTDVNLPRDVLVVVSKLKAYVRARSGMNTSDGVMPVLSEVLRKICDDAIRRAGRAGRKTVLDRDIAAPE